MNSDTIARPRACSNPARPSPSSTRGADVAALLRAFGFDGDEIALACSPLAIVLRSAASALEDDARATVRPGAPS